VYSPEWGKVSQSFRGPERICEVLDVAMRQGETGVDVGKIIEDLYEGTLDPGAWDRAILGVADAVRASGAMLFAFNPSKQSVLRDENHRVDPQTVRDYARHWTYEDDRLRFFLNVPACRYGCISRKRRRLRSVYWDQAHEARLRCRISRLLVGFCHISPPPLKFGTGWRPRKSAPPISLISWIVNCLNLLFLSHPCAHDLVDRRLGDAAADG
jgi:hypothetical protein